jgi:ABC-type polysaccharide/polyol phosphate transport system ATPase subunit
MNGTILGMKKRGWTKFEAIVSFSGVERFVVPIKRYSSGMRMRLGFSSRCALEPDVLIVDEVLAVGDAAPRSASAPCGHAWRGRTCCSVVPQHGGR